jgi:integrase
MASVLKRGDLQWQAQIRKKGFPTLIRTFRSKEEAKAWAAEEEAKMYRGIWRDNTEAERTTLEKAIDRYLKEETVKKKGKKQETNRLNAWKRLPLAKRPLAAITGADMAEYRDARLKAGLSPSTVNNDLIVISHLFTVARKEWRMEMLANPVSNMRKPSVPKGRDRRLLPGEEERLLEAAEEPMRSIIIIAIDTAMRASEQQFVGFNDVNWITKTLTITDTKNGESRKIPLTKRAVKTIDQLPRRIDDYLFPRISSDNISHKFGAVCRKAGIEGLRFHDLRHEAISRLFERGLNIMEVAAISGHKTLTMLKRYTHLRAEDLVSRLL